MISRLVDVLLISAVRAGDPSRPESGFGLFKGFSDPRVGRAMASAHADLARAWTVDLLAREAGLSRSVFADHFRRVVGEPPLEFLTRWRMYVAGRRLRTTSESVGQVAVQVGYESEAAFSKAFKRVMRIGPGQFRKKGTDGLGSSVVPAAAYPHAA